MAHSEYKPLLLPFVIGIISLASAYIAFKAYIIFQLLGVVFFIFSIISGSHSLKKGYRAQKDSPHTIKITMFGIMIVVVVPVIFSAYMLLMIGFVILLN